ENKGICYTANEGIKLAKGKYHTFVSSDDAMLPNNIELQVQFLEENAQYLCSYTDGYEIHSDDMDNSDYSKAVKFSHHLPFKKGNLRQFMLNNLFTIPSPA